MSDPFKAGNSDFQNRNIINVRDRMRGSEDSPTN